MKKLLVAVLIIVMLFAFAACSGDTSDKTSDSNASTSEDPVNEEAEVVELSFESFEKALTDKGIAFEKEETLYALIGAKSGYEYTLNDSGNIELYNFDTSTEEYKSFIKDGAFNGAKLILNGNYVFAIVTPSDNANLAQEIFESNK